MNAKKNVSDNQKLQNKKTTLKHFLSAFVVVKKQMRLNSYLNTY